MTTSSPDDTTPDGSESRPPVDEDVAQSGEASEAQGDDGAIPPKQVHRWKDEGGALHPHD